MFPATGMIQNQPRLAGHVVMHDNWRIARPNASETLEQQQDSNPRHANSTPKKCLTLPLESIKEDTKQPLAERL